MGQQYQDTISSFAASPQAMDQQQTTQTAGNNTPGKSLEQSPMHDGFGTRSGMYDNGMDVSAQPAPVATPPQPQSQPASAGINPSWAQQGRKRGGRAKRADGGQLPGWSSGPISPLMMTGDTLAKMPAAQSPMNVAQPPGGQMPPAANIPPVAGDYASQYQSPEANIYAQKLSNEDFIDRAYVADLNRQAEESGKNFWLDQLKSGNMTQQDVENAILNSPEANANFVSQIYQSDLGRNPEASGQQYWADILNNKGPVTRQDVERGILNSPEGRQYMLSQGIIPDVGGRVDPFVAGYNARMANAQNLYGGIAQQNAAQNTADQAAYEQQLKSVQEANQQRLAAAQQARAERQAREAEAARQQQLMVALLLLNRQ